MPISETYDAAWQCLEHADCPINFELPDKFEMFDRCRNDI